MSLQFGTSEASAEKDCAKSSIGLTPLTELGPARYHGVRGGLYPDGRNQRPTPHEQAGLAIAKTITPLDERGRPDPRNGKIILFACGMSNAFMEFNAFQNLVRRRGGVNPQLVLVNGAQGGASAELWVNADDPVWDHVRNELMQAGVSALQVQVAWLKHAHHEPQKPFPLDAVAIKRDLVRIVQLLKQHFPNLKLAYLSSRAYGGYARGALNPDPYAYDSGFGVKWVIEEQLRGNPELNDDPAKGPVRAPWLSWGPYLWADGLTTRQDGLSWRCEDFLNDGTHPSDWGRSKVARLLWQFFTTDPTATPWFLTPPNQP